jgi:hypothetical protein
MKRAAPATPISESGTPGGGAAPAKASIYAGGILNAHSAQFTSR